MTLTFLPANPASPHFITTGTREGVLLPSFLGWGMWCSDAQDDLVKVKGWEGAELESAPRSASSPTEIGCSSSQPLEATMSHSHWPRLARGLALWVHFHHCCSWQLTKETGKNPLFQLRILKFREVKWLAQVSGQGQISQGQGPAFGPKGYDVLLRSHQGQLVWQESPKLEYPFYFLTSAV